MKVSDLIPPLKRANRRRKGLKVLVRTTNFRDLEIGSVEHGYDGDGNLVLLLMEK